ncbi:MAG TPA: guanylate kinase [Flavobacteriales bacterium]|nr:guanylate kinase [Flavobacteriales bacterium]
MSNEQGKCVIISAPSGAGKTTIVHHLLKAGLGLAFSVSATSRSKRGHEVDGKDYFFITADEFKARISADAFVEWEEVYAGQFYGTLKAEIDRIWSEKHSPVFDVDVEGGLNLKKVFGDRALALFVAPPSLAVLEQRLRSRGTETPESLQRRVDKAEHELVYSDRFDGIVVNDDLERACAEAEERIRNFLRA